MKIAVADVTLELDVLAAYAAVVATILGVLRVIEWRETRQRLHFSIYPADLMSELPDYKLKRESTVLVIAVGNRAPYPLHVTHIAFRLRRGTALMQMRPPAGAPTLPKKLEPSEGLDWLMVRTSAKNSARAASTRSRRWSRTTDRVASTRAVSRARSAKGSFRHSAGAVPDSGGGQASSGRSPRDCDPAANPNDSAEGVGFEPTESLHPQRFSRPPHSTALPPLRGNDYGLAARVGVPGE